jgi:hypothetical protein
MWHVYLDNSVSVFPKTVIISKLVSISNKSNNTQTTAVRKEDFKPSPNHSETHTHVRTHARTHTHTHYLSVTHTYKLTGEARTHTHTHTLPHTIFLSNTLSLSHTHTLPHTQTRARIHT